MTIRSISDEQGQKIVSTIGMTVLLTSFGMLFASLLLGYFALRLTSSIWPPMGMPKVPLAWPSVSTAIILLSSFFLFRFEKDALKQRSRASIISFVVTLGLGCGFVLTQFILWREMAKLGLYVEGGIFPSLMYTMTWVHAAHILVGLVALVSIAPLVGKKNYLLKEELRITNVSKFWHFLGIVWGVIFLVMFVY